MQKEVTAVFDIGKTNKKFFLFDMNFKEVYREYTRFDEIKDEDGYPTEDLSALQIWVKTVFDRVITEKKFKITTVNFSTYGASWVHLDAFGKPLTPLYNYTKPLDTDIISQFYAQYGPELAFSIKTGATNSGMLNSGMQLYWLKHKKPEVFKKIKYSLHLPQYISYLFTGVPVSEYTSIGCHTALWDYEKETYHHWVYEENIHELLPPIVSTETSLNIKYKGASYKIGVGIHDSSAALLPYLRSVRKKFVLVSTGTWSIALNPFSKNMLSKEDVEKECINYMRIQGKPVKSSRLFLGNEYTQQVQELTKRYQVTPTYHKTVKFDPEIFYAISKSFEHRFQWKSIPDQVGPSETTLTYDTFESAYHHLMIELVLLQVQSIRTAMGNTPIKRLYIDGGFSDNDVFIQLLSHYLPTMKLRTTNASLGSALGAAIVISDAQLNAQFLKVNYALQKHDPFILH